jgi:DNA-binding NarL/FixJ family response regulator
MDNNRDEQPILLSDGDKGLVELISRGLTDDEIAAQLQISKAQVLHRIAGLLAKLGAQERLEIIFYAYSDPEMCRLMCTDVKRYFNLPTMKQTAS